jgi:hypothetical protein
LPSILFNPENEAAYFSEMVIVLHHTPQHYSPKDRTLIASDVRTSNTKNPGAWYNILKIQKIVLDQGV